MKLWIKKNYFRLFVCAIFFIEIIFLFYSNITQMEYHMGYDASYFYNKAIEIWHQKTLFLKNWSDQTALNFDTSIIFAALLYGITNDIFVSYGIANIIFDILLIFVIYNILKELFVEFEYRTMGVCLLICPYLALEFNNANDLGYYSMLLGNCQAYAGRIVLCLLILMITLQIENGKRNYRLIGLSCLWSFICGISSGLFVVVMIILPITIFYILKIVLEKGEKKYFTGIIFAVANAIAIFIGKVIQTKTFHFEAKDDSINFLHVGDFWKNVGNIIIGFFQLIGIYPTSADVSVTSFIGMTYLLKIVYFIILLIAIFTILRGTCFDKLEMYLLPLFIVLTNVLMFSIGNFTYNSQYFEYRYLILDTILLSIVLCCYLNRKFDYIKRKTFVSIVLGVCLLGNSLSSFVIYSRKTLDTQKYQYVISKIEKENVPVVFVSNNLEIDGRNWDVYLDDKNVKVFSFNESGTNLEERLWGCSTAYGENAEWMGKSILICQKEEFEAYPSFLQHFYKKIGEYNDVLIYKADRNYLDFNSNVVYNNVNLFPYSPGVIVQNGNMSDEKPVWLSDGTEGYVMHGPYAKWLKGEYLVTIQYAVDDSENDKAGYFELVTDGGNVVWASSDILNNEQEMTIRVSLNEDLEGYELRCFEYKGTKIEIGKIEIQKL